MTSHSNNHEALPPNYGPFIRALRSVGYSFEESVADIIDNSIDAQAWLVSLKFIIRNDQSVDLLIVDNGNGMDALRLREAMVFGSKSEEKEREKRLGMFGLGLKLASIAQAVNLHVVSLKKGQTSGRAWTDEGLKRGFYCQLLDADACESISNFCNLPLEHDQGTWVLWQNLFRFSERFDSPEQLCSELSLSLRKHLGLHLHRFLNRLRIDIEIVDESLRELAVIQEVSALDPFAYGASAIENYPAELFADGEYSSKMAIKAHIWPASSDSKEYKLPGGALKRQGLYFYRNDRLLSGGGWHGIRDGLDAHDSLARVAIDLHVEVEREASVDVRKAMVKLTPQMREAIHKSTNKEGITFKKFLNEANRAYRKKIQASPKAMPMIPQAGYPAEMTARLARLLDRHDVGFYRPLQFEWAAFNSSAASDFFVIDRDACTVFLNEEYRDLFLRGKRHIKNDAVLVKTLLFLLLKDLLDKERGSEKQEKWIAELNKMLAAGASFEMKQNE